jgi:CBS domain-containing protein
MLVRDIMTANVEMVAPGDTLEQAARKMEEEDDDVQDAARLMKEKQVRRLLVMSRAGELVGIVSLGDLATEAGDRGQSGEILEEVPRST